MTNYFSLQWHSSEPSVKKGSQNVNNLVNKPIGTHSPKKNKNRSLPTSHQPKFLLSESDLGIDVTAAEMPAAM